MEMRDFKMFSALPAIQRDGLQKVNSELLIHDTLESKLIAEEENLVIAEVKL